MVVWSGPLLDGDAGVESVADGEEVVVLDGPVPPDGPDPPEAGGVEALDGDGEGVTDGDEEGGVGPGEPDVGVGWGVLVGLVVAVGGGEDDEGVGDGEEVGVAVGLLRHGSFAPISIQPRAL